MALSDTPVFVQTPELGLVQIVNADASGLKTVITAGADGTKVTALLLSSDDSSSRDVTWGVTRSGTFYPRGTVSVPANAGVSATVAPVDAMAPAVCPGLPLDDTGKGYILLESGDTLQIKALTTVTSTKAISAAATGGHF